MTCIQLSSFNFLFICQAIKSDFWRLNHTIIKVENVSLVLGKNKILSSVNLESEQGKIYGLIGRNGSGKTMLMKCICGFIVPTEGKITVSGKVIGKDVDFVPDAGIIIETPGFIPRYSGFKNLELLAMIKKKIGAYEIKAAIERVGLDPDLKLSVKNTPSA